MSNRERLSIRFTLLLNDTIKTQAEELAKARSRSVGSLIRSLITREHGHAASLPPTARARYLGHAPPDSDVAVSQR